MPIVRCKYKDADGSIQVIEHDIVEVVDADGGQWTVPRSLAEDFDDLLPMYLSLSTGVDIDRTEPLVKVLLEHVSNSTTKKERGRDRRKEAATQPRPNRRHPSRERAMQIAAEVNGKTTSQKAQKILDRLAAEGLIVPSERSVREWLTFRGS